MRKVHNYKRTYPEWVRSTLRRDAGFLSLKTGISPQMIGRLKAGQIKTLKPSIVVALRVRHERSWYKRMRNSGVTKKEASDTIKKFSNTQKELGYIRETIALNLKVAKTIAANKNKWFQDYQKYLTVERKDRKGNPILNKRTGKPLTKKILNPSYRQFIRDKNGKKVRNKLWTRRWHTMKSVLKGMGYSSSYSSEGGDWITYVKQVYNITLPF